MTTIVLVPGAWLGAWAWRDVADVLRDAGHDVRPLTLTGLAERAGEAGPKVDLDTHVADIADLIEGDDLRDVVLVGHSYGGMPVSVAAGPLAERLAAVVYVDSGKLPDGTSQLDTAPPEDQARTRVEGAETGLVSPPAFDPAEDPVNLAGLDADAVRALRDGATPHPFGAIAQSVRYRPAAREVPTTLVACTFPVEQVRALIQEGHPYFAAMADAEVIGLPTGHWPMFSEPAKLAAILDAIARR
jgi:pimeloyl-ACP methyl ester carboxylesterase